MKATLTPKERRHINKALTALGDYHLDLPIQQIREILEKYGIEIPGWDGAIFCGAGGVDSEPLFKDGVEIKHLLVFTWYKMALNFECVMYVS